MKYLYFKLWRDFTGQVKDNTPALYSMIWLSCINCVYIIALMVLINHFIKIELLYFDRNSLIFCSSFFAIAMILLNYFLLYKKRKSIAEKYKNETRFQKTIGFIILYAYMLGAFISAYFASKLFPVN